eukprot:gene15204-16774_t
MNRSSLTAKETLQRCLPNFISRAESIGKAHVQWYQCLLNNFFYKVADWDKKELRDDGHGSIFNVEFSKDGRVLVSACEDKSISLFDPFSYKNIATVKHAHSDCINCIRFINLRTFATCSDDKTVAIWDIRRLDRVLNTLKGHSSWVKSIEYNEASCQVLSSAFDDTVRAWDINCYNSEDCSIKGDVVLNLSALVRIKLSPDWSKLFLTTTSGLGIIVIHDLNLDTISNDLKNLDSINSSSSSPSSLSSQAMKRRENRLEIIREFPSKAKPGCISSIDVHPYGWCILSRYSDIHGRWEWSCVHDIQDHHLGGCNSNCQHPSSILTHFISEPNVGRGYIKELCFNSDGRLLSSPFGNGLRLLAFDSGCNELSDCVPRRPAELTEIKTLIGHKAVVLTSAFSPSFPLLASGCLDGRVCFYLPKL